MVKSRRDAKQQQRPTFLSTQKRLLLGQPAFWQVETVRCSSVYSFHPAKRKLTK